MSRCKGCGAEIIWLRTPWRKAMPCDPEPVEYWQSPTGLHRIVTADGEVVSADLEGEPKLVTGVGYVSHFATCPKADEFRRKKRREEQP